MRRVKHRFYVAIRVPVNHWRILKRFVTVEESLDFYDVVPLGGQVEGKAVMEIDTKTKTTILIAAEGKHSQADTWRPDVDTN